MEENQNNLNNQNTPSTDSSVMPTGGSNIGQAATQGAKKVVRKGGKSFKKAVSRGLRAIWLVLPTQVKIVVIVVMIILIVLCALLMMGMISKGTSVASSNVDDYISGATDLDDEAKSLYDEKASLLKMKLKDINKIYNKFIKDEKGGAETQNLMKYKIGTNDVSDDKKNNRIVSIDDKLPLYKHILLTEKYNFNNIKWQKYYHTNSTVGDKVENFKEDKELGLKYPDDSKNTAGGDNPNPTKLEKFIDLTLPYLQTWYIPLSMSNASVISGVEEDNSRAPAFSYNIIKEAYSNIIVNWYELKKHTTVTQYWTYDKVERHDTLYNVVVDEFQKKPLEALDTYVTTGYSADNSNVNVVTTEDNKTKYDTSTNNGLKGGKKDPMKETLVSQKDEYTSNFYIKQADVFDAKIINEFNYQVYSDSDASKRINADSSNETESNWTKPAEKLENKYSNSISCDVMGNPIVNGGKASASSTLTNTETVTNVPGSSDIRIIRRTYTVKLGKYYEYENGLEHTVTRMWRDKLSQESSETNDYTIDDLILYNQSDDRKEKVKGEDLCGSSYKPTFTAGKINEGTSTPATEITVDNYKYPVFNQNSYPYTTKHGGSTISQAGCGLCCLTTVVGGITGRKVDPKSCGDDTNWIAPKSLAQIAADLKNVYNIDAEATKWYNRSSGPSVSEKENISKTKIVGALKNNNPVIALVKPDVATLGTTAGGAHYITLVGLNGNNVIIANSAGGTKQEYDIDYVIEKMYTGPNDECGFVVAKRSGTPSNSPSNSPTSIPIGTGEAKVTKSDLNSTGYTGVFTSGTTGRSFKEYKQNGNTFINKYNISSVGCSWSSECGTVSIIIVGSGYSDKATFADATSKLKSTGRRNTVHFMVK